MKEEIKEFFKGEVFDDDATLAAYSHDASLFTVRPKLVVWPEDAEDIENLVKWVGENKDKDPTLSLTVRAAGSDMSGGPLNESIIADVTKHMNYMDAVSEESVWTEPGIFYRDFEAQTLAKDLIFPAFPASKALCALGGMLGNNCAGEKTLRYGKMENLILESRAIFSDGREYDVKPLNKTELEAKMAQGDFEGNIYKQVFELIEENKELLSDAKPKVSKNSAGYYLWNVWDGATFNLNRLLVGAQGTLGIFTEAKLRLYPIKKHHDLVAIFFKSWDALPKAVNEILPLEPESLETFDEETLKLGLRFMPEIAHKVHSSVLSFALKFLPEAWMGLRVGGLPKLILLVEIAEESEEAVKAKIEKLKATLERDADIFRVIEKDSDEEKYWVMRRESFNLLRQHVQGKRTAPFVDDFCIQPDQMTQFLPKVKKVLEDSGIEVNIAGHAGNGNYHIIPLMDLTRESERAKIPRVADEIYTLVGQYHGTITAEHNDGLVRTPYLGKMYPPEILKLFKKVKEIFDPLYIFNPGKKVPIPDGAGSVAYLTSHIAVN